MNYIDAFQKRLHDATASVEQEIQSHNQQVEVLTQRLEGLKRAVELFQSEQAAMGELLQVGTANGGAIARAMPTLPAAKAQKATASPKPSDAQKQRAPNTQSHSKTLARGATRKASQNSSLTRIDMIAAVLKRHPRRTVRELIALLNTTESG